MRKRFVKVIPKDYQRVLAGIRRAHEQGLTGDEAVMAAFEENAHDLRTRRRQLIQGGIKMGKPTGFMEYLRELPVDRTPQDRVRDWNEFHHHMEEKHLRQQAARCMDCGVPFCHTGVQMSSGASGCR